MTEVMKVTKVTEVREVKGMGEERRIKNFEDLVMWQKAHELFLKTARDVAKFPRSMVGRIMTDQLVRAVASIGANIAEGYGGHKGREFQHYLIMARRSAVEAQNWFINCRDLGFLDEATFERRYQACEEIITMINFALSSLRKGKKEAQNVT